MKKILLFISGIYNGGTEIALYNLISNLDTNRYKIYINYTDDKNIFKPLATKILEYAEYIDINNKIEVDTLIYCNAANNEIRKIKDNVKYIKSYFWFHYFGDGQEEFVVDLINNNEVDKVITVCETVKNILLKWDCFLDKQDKVITNYNILNSSEIKKKSEEHIEMNLSNNINLITVARFAVVKGYHRVKVLVDCMLKKSIDFKLFIIGSGNTQEDENRVRNMFKDYKNVEFLGYQENPFKYVRQCDYNVLLSDRENMSLALLEAKILGVPSIVTDFDSAYEQVEDMKTGIILSRERLETYQERIDDIVNNMNFFKKNVQNFEYSAEEAINKWENLLNNFKKGEFILR